MIKKERLYDAFGELIYALAMADGEVQQEEIQTLERILNHHPYAKEIKWSFDYENAKQNTVEEAYQKAILACKDNGPDPEYKYLLDIMMEVAAAFDGIVPQEQKIIENFKTELRERFIHDIETNNLWEFDD
jgi:uncharacterized tellurite resistance protein B-like protein